MMTTPHAYGASVKKNALGAFRTSAEAVPLVAAEDARRSVSPWVWALLYALLMVAVPWESLTGMPFEDRDVYVSKLKEGTPIIEEQDIRSVQEFILYEALWDLTVRETADFSGIDVENVLLGVSFICFLIYSKYLFQRYHPVLCLLFLLNPIVIDFGMSQLRMALAASLLLLAMESKLLPWRLVLTVTAFFLHTASTIFIGGYLIGAWIARRVGEQRMSKNGAVLVAILFVTVIIFAIGPGREAILSYVEDRRMEYQTPSSSKLYAVIWIMLLVFQLVQPRQYFENKANMLSLTLVLTFVMSVFFGIYGSRFIAVGFPLVISSIMLLDQSGKSVLLPAFLVYETSQWYYWMTPQ